MVGIACQLHLRHWNGRNSGIPFGWYKTADIIKTVRELLRGKYDEFGLIGDSGQETTESC